jgi:hypothetical protein
VAARRAAGDRFLGLRLTAATSDRFFLGASVQQPEPSFTVTTIIRSPLDAIAEARAAIPAQPGSAALAAQLDSARRKLEQAEGLVAAGDSAGAQRPFCQARKHLDDLIAKVATFTGNGHLTGAQGDVLVAAVEEARRLVDQRVTALGLAACSD